MVDLQTQGANRIANGTFELDGQEHQLDQNNGSHHLHGGGLPVDSNLRGGHEAKHLFKHQTVFWAEVEFSIFCSDPVKFLLQPFQFRF